MVVNKLNRRLFFLSFIVPALAFYLFFAILPLGQGLWLSTMTWDGTAPWTPAQMSIADFESRILNKVISKDDQTFVLKYYRKDLKQGTYIKEAVYGLERYRLQMIISSTGYENPSFQFVGLNNYLELFSGKTDPRLFPQDYRESRFQSGNSLDEAVTISGEEWKNNLTNHITDPEKILFLQNAYELVGKDHKLKTDPFAISDLDLQLQFQAFPGLENDWEDLYTKISNLGVQGKKQELESLLEPFSSAAKKRVSSDASAALKKLAETTYSINYLKGILADSWYASKVKMGVIPFTIFFSFFNVVLVNLIALLLAFALDTNIKSRNILRSVFFIPNVLSMIIVAFIWQLVFSQLLPSLTGIQTWIMNPDLAPWITVFVATWQGLGYYTVIYLAGLQNIPQELVEVSSIDGAFGWTKFVKIILPLLAPAITICLFLSIAGSLKTFDILFALYPNNSTTMGVDNIVVNIFYDAFRDKNTGYATAKAVILLLIILVITAFQVTASKKKEIEF